MPVYEYFCPSNNTAIEIEHSIKDTLRTWGDICELTAIDSGETPADAPVERLLYPVSVATPKTNSDLKNLGFTKLVKRDDGVYENVTRTGEEKRYMTRGDAASVPHVHKKVGD